MEDTVEQASNSEKNKTEHLKPWQFQPGQSGNPKGRTPGSSLKEYAKQYLATLTEEERLKYFEGLDKLDVWQMGEGKPETKTDITSGGEPLKSVDPTDPVILESLKAIQEKLENE